MQDTCRPTTLLTDGLLWNFTGFPNYILTTQPPDASGYQTREQGGISNRLETE